MSCFGSFMDGDVDVVVEEEEEEEDVLVDDVLVVLLPASFSMLSFSDEGMGDETNVLVTARNSAITLPLSITFASLVNPL